MKHHKATKTLLAVMAVFWVTACQHTNAGVSSWQPTMNLPEVTVVNDQAVAKNCPHIGNPDDEYNHNFGCANTMNLASMLARPHDAVEGRKADPADANQGAGALYRYRSDAVKELMRDDVATSNTQ